MEFVLNLTNVFFLIFFFIYNTYITYNTCVLKYVLQYLHHY